VAQLDVEVAVVGAGPAGAAAAIRLRQLGRSVCLIDDVAEGTLKAGESLPGAAQRLLRRLGIQELSAILKPTAFAPCTGNASSWGAEEWVYTDALRNPEGGGWHLLRHQFDEALRQVARTQGAGFVPAKVARLNYDATATRPYTISLKSTGASLPTSIHANWMIDASGRPAVVLKQLRVGRQTSVSPQLSVIAWLRPAAGDVDALTRVKSVAAGWWYTARLPDGRRVVSCQGIPAPMAALVRSPDLFVAAFNQANLLPRPIAVTDIVAGPQAKSSGIALADLVASPTGWLAVGDAALSFDPLSSQGMFFALYSGIRGAEVVAARLAGASNAIPLLDEYKRRLGLIHQQNQRSAKLHYTSETRFKDAPYWRPFFEGY